MIYEEAKKISGELIELRREFHKIPELEACEFKTSELICKKLNEMGIPYKKCYGTGIVAVIKGKKGNGKTLLLRADMDALPMVEKTDVNFKSIHKGCMHACGHDIHMTALFGACKLLMLSGCEFYGNVKAVFQPAEEGDGGAEPMIREGVMNSPLVDSAIALHVEPLASYNTLQYRNGSIMASPDDFKIIVKGKGGHGACPEKCINPIYAAAELVKSLSNVVSDNFPNPDVCVVSVCTINGGTMNNIIPDTVEITGTARSLDIETRKKIEILIENCIRKSCGESGCTYEYHFRKLYPPVINDKKMNEIVINAAKKLGCFEKIEELEKASMTGDDFSYFSQLVPSSYFKLGAGNDKINKPLHSSEFDVDERCICRGAAVLAQSALDYLNGESILK